MLNRHMASWERERKWRMIAKLFDAHNKLIQELDLPEVSPTLQLARKTFRLIDTDERGAPVYREVDEETTNAIEKSAAGEKAEK
jgi:hypothetical protein